LLWKHACWWYVAEQHACDHLHGMRLISSHKTQEEAQAAADARYPRPHDPV